METNEDKLTPHEDMRQLWGRAVATPPPVPPTRSRSVPVDEIPQPFSAWRPTPLPQDTTKQSSAGLDTTDVDSISNRLNFATDQLRERHRFDTRDTTTPEVSSLQLSDIEYVTPWQNSTHEVNNDQLSYQQQQRPDILRGEVYYNFWDGHYRLIHNNERINPNSAICHEGWDQCYYFSQDKTWKSASLVDFPDDTAYYV